MSHPSERTEILIQPAGVATLAEQHVLIAGLGGVGSYCAEALARAGIGRITLLDHDVVAESNLNRQLVALHSTVGRPKVQVMAERIRDINPTAELYLHQEFLYHQEAAHWIQAQRADFVADCIDSIACKAALVAGCRQGGIPVVTSLGAGNRLDVRRVRVSTLDAVQGCRLGRELRRMLRKLDTPLDYPVVYSDEPRRQPLPHQPVSGPPGRSRAVNGTISYLPALFGMMVAGVIIQALLEKNFPPTS